MGRASIIKNRRHAFIRQGGKCFYCTCDMWESGIESHYAASQRLGLKWNNAGRTILAQRLCTAEHLKRRTDGGSNHALNIVASCCLCNSIRHDSTPEEHRARMKPAEAATVTVDFSVLITAFQTSLQATKPRSAHHQALLTELKTVRTQQLRAELGGRI